MTKNKRSLSLVLAFLILVSTALSAGFSSFAANYKTVEGRFNYSYASEVLTLVNKERSSYGLKPVVMTEKLTDSSMLRAAETSVSFSHTRPNTEQCFTAFEWTRAAGENIAYGQKSPAEVMNGWMNSSGHRANILNSSFTTIGIGCFEKNGVLYWAQAFSGGSGNSYSPSGQKQVSVDVSLTSGVNSTVRFTSASQPTTKQSTTKQTTTKSATTKPATTKPSTTKQTTTKAQTTQNKKQSKNIYSKIRYYFYYYFR